MGNVKNLFLFSSLFSSPEGVLKMYTPGDSVYTYVNVG